MAVRVLHQHLAGLWRGGVTPFKLSSSHRVALVVLRSSNKPHAQRHRPASSSTRPFSSSAWAAAASSAAMAPVDQRVGFIGAGMMAEALARGFISAGVVEPGSMCATDVASSRREVFQAAGVTAYTSAVDVAKNADVLILAVKPPHVAGVLAKLAGELTANHLLVSIAAGITLSTLQSGAGPECKVVRVMPNICCLVGSTAGAIAMGQNCTKEEKALVETLFGAVGRVHTLEEKLLDAVTGLSGSGPAFIFTVIEAMADGGVVAGLPRDIAQSLAAQTVLGAAKMVLEDGRHPGALKDSVCSPAGTSIAGMRALEEGGVRAGIMNAVIAAAERSREMGKQS
eukprot:jgi/Chlat1/5145/Chrsp33S05143